MIRGLISILRKYWLPLLCATVAVCMQAVVIMLRPRLYKAECKLVIGFQSNTLSEAQMGELDHELGTGNFFHNQIQIIEGRELRSRALKSVRKRHPEMKEIVTDVHVIQTPGSSILNIGVIGEEPEYARAYCDALLDEFLLFRKAVFDKSDLFLLINGFMEQESAKDRLVKEREGALNAFLKVHDSELIESEHARLVASLSAVRGEIASLQQTGSSGPELEGKRDWQVSIEKALHEYSELYTELQRLKRDREIANNSLREMGQISDKVINPFFSIDSMLNVMERPSKAEPVPVAIALPLIMAGLLGALVGFVMQGIASLFLSKPPPHSPSA